MTASIAHRDVATTTSSTIATTIATAIAAISSPSYRLGLSRSLATVASIASVTCGGVSTSSRVSSISPGVSVTGVSTVSYTAEGKERHGQDSHD